MSATVHMGDRTKTYTGEMPSTGVVTKQSAERTRRAEDLIRQGVPKQQAAVTAALQDMEQIAQDPAQYRATINKILEYTGRQEAQSLGKMAKTDPIPRSLFEDLVKYGPSEADIEALAARQAAELPTGDKDLSDTAQGKREAIKKRFLAKDKTLYDYEKRQAYDELKRLEPKTPKNPVPRRDQPVPSVETQEEQAPRPGRNRGVSTYKKASVAEDTDYFAKKMAEILETVPRVQQADITITSGQRKTWEDYMAGKIKRMFETGQVRTPTTLNDLARMAS
jgi:hypothetical protein